MTEKDRIRVLAVDDHPLGAIANASYLLGQLGPTEPQVRPVAIIRRQVQHLVRMVDLPSRVLSMTLGGLSPGQATRKHRHNYETIIYVVAGSGVSIVEDREGSIWIATGGGGMRNVWSPGR